MRKPYAPGFFYSIALVGCGVAAVIMGKGEIAATMGGFALLIDLIRAIEIRRQNAEIGDGSPTTLPGHWFREHARTKSGQEISVTLNTGDAKTTAVMRDVIRRATAEIVTIAEHVSPKGRDNG